MKIKDSFGYLRNILAILGPKEAPRDLIFFVTSRCNAKCHFCLFREQVDDPSRIAEELKLEEIEKIAKNYGPLSKLSLSGGEPFIRQDVAEIVDYFVKYCGTKIVDIPTNGYFVDSVRRQVGKILENNPGIVLEIQLSIDGPKEIHEKIRGVPGIFDKVLQTYHELDNLRRQYSNLKIKINLTYVADNKAAVVDLVKKFDREYSFDRLQITFPHGCRIEDKINQLSYQEFYRLSKRVQFNFRPRHRFDLHSALFRAIKIIRDEVLLDVMAKGDAGRICNAGKNMIVIDDTGKVYPCEPLWLSVGSLRQVNYEIKRIIDSEEMKKFAQSHLGKNKCHCSWGNVILTSIVHTPKLYPRIAFYFLYLLFKPYRGLKDL